MTEICAALVVLTNLWGTVSVDLDGHPVPSDATELRLVGQGIMDLSGLQRLTMLKSLDLSVNSIQNIYPLVFSDCRSTITSLNLSNNLISDITPLSMMSAVEYLDLSYNSISSLQPLMGLSTLRSLRLSGNPLSIQDINMLCFALPECEVVF